MVWSKMPMEYFTLRGGVGLTDQVAQSSAHRTERRAVRTTEVIGIVGSTPERAAARCRYIGSFPQRAQIGDTQWHSKGCVARRMR